MVIQQSNIYPAGAAAAGSARQNMTARPQKDAARTEADAEQQRISLESSTEGRDSEEVRRDEDEVRRLEALARRERERENVVARSEDGDTLQVEKDDSRAEGDIGEVTRKGDRDDAEDRPVSGGQDMDAPRLDQTNRDERAIEDITEEAIERVPRSEPEIAEGAEAVLEKQIMSPDIEDTAEQLAQKDADRFKDAAQQVSSTYAGISDSRLEQMYRDGVISRFDYESEIEARDAAREQLQEDNEDLSKRMGRIAGEGERVVQNFEAIRTATSDEADDTLTAGQRLDIIDDLQKTTADENRREEDNNRVWQYQSLA